MKQFFVTGISTDVGKTITSAVLVEALEADYWKPVQTGDDSDSETISNLISNTKTVLHKSSYSLKAPMSPHAAAALEGVYIDHNKIQEPKTENHMVIEGAGGVLVPLNDSDTLLDIIMPTYHVVVVVKHYLGSINHSLLTIKWLLLKGYDVAILFNGEPNKASEDIITKITGVPVLGRIGQEATLTKEVVKKYAEQLRPALMAW
ncbi:dethiobiotin synthetase [Arenibacter algicola]|jgi:dethiobiotin synthetase|uniref:ATP-dependent dethiobiotin synthetase BioD n=1 Tax=Arenibacter algicola TaxID=616991 RepID=A0ABY3AES0_9FLAO|nr:MULTISPECIES: dethiobiotin synthase [Arenibacter]MBD3662170.1 dethiobiotin synthase [Arenibacter algicola]GBF18251.1 ATP-dependent dethiobiotin synthetase BioD 1 [Arenibacter sp. NBRC 103722]|tara:strand:+ start:944 stop:1555 length:612 start_codon:yes stop_codon:yes gene_type:complete